jgi:hypothetical protein
MTNQQIIESCNTEITECSCDVCKNMCRTPCLGTPEDIANLIKKGYFSRLAKTAWAFGVMVGTHNKMVNMVQAQIDDKTGFCTFYKNGKCELHDLGLKPLEGKLANCKNKKPTSLEELKELPIMKIVAEWEQSQ